MSKELGRLKDELLDDEELTDEIFEYVIDTSSYIAEKVWEEAEHIINGCRTVEELEDLRDAVINHAKEKKDEVKR